MDPDKKLEEQISQYQALARENKDVDVAALMVNALQSQKQNLLSPKTKRWAYLISLGLPPLGLLFALKFYTSSEDEARTAAHVCVGLTIFSLLILWLMAKIIFSGSGADLNQIQQIKPSDIQQLLE